MVTLGLTKNHQQDSNRFFLKYTGAKSYMAPKLVGAYVMMIKCYLINVLRYESANNVVSTLVVLQL